MGSGAIGAPRHIQPRSGPMLGRSTPAGPSARDPARPCALATNARCVLVSTVFAFGLAGLVLSLGEMEAVSPAYAAVNRAAPAPAIPQARLAPGIADEAALDEPAAPAAPAPTPALADLPASLQPDPEEVLGFGPMRVRRHLVGTIVAAARKTGIDPVLLMSIADKESSFAVEVQARTSSATGLFQFIEKTWLLVVQEFGAKHGLATEAAAITVVDGEPGVADPAARARILDLRRDPALSSVLAAEMLLRDRARIARTIGRELTIGETYIAHFLGPDDAERFLAKLVGEPATAAAALLPKPARANKPIFYARARRKAKPLTVAEVHQKFETMMSLRSERYRAVPALVASAEAPAVR